jgi:hypothetical protein
METLGKMPGRGSEDHGTDADEESYAMKSDKGAAEALDEG